MDYTNTDFVGQILPKVKPNGEVTYDFNPGPFALALKTAIEHSDEAVALIIEELNRGNAASIFGDIFQLLDRDANGKSQYSITNVNLQDYLNKCFEGVYTFDSISIPANTEILCLDVAVSALSSMLGEVLIPIPILGTLIGNTVGMFMLEISKVYLGKTEQKLIEKYRAQYMTVVKKLNEEYQSYVISLNAEIEQYNSLVALAFDGDANTRFELTVDVAQLAGVDTSKILKTDEERDAFFSTSDCN